MVGADEVLLRCMGPVNFGCDIMMLCENVLVANQGVLDALVAEARLHARPAKPARWPQFLSKQNLERKYTTFSEDRCRTGREDVPRCSGTSFHQNSTRCLHCLGLQTSHLCVLATE